VTNRALAIASVAVLSVLSCRPGARATRKQTRLLMDTYVTIEALGSTPVADRAVESAFVRLEQINRKFNHLDTASPLYAFNAGLAPLADSELVRVVEAAVGVSEASGGAFDITVEPLVRLWGFYGDHQAVPSQRQIDSCLEFVGYGKLRIEDGRVTRLDPRVRVDLGGIAKGYALGEAVKVLKQAGITSAIVDLGGDVYALGRKGIRQWKVGIRDPRGEGVVDVVAAENIAVVTSGDYERFFLGPDSVRYCHIIDPKTGSPARGAASATVLLGDPVAAQGWSKVLFIRGKDALPLVEASGWAGLLITDRQEVVRSAGWPE
jgi:thiamine biosynthesis lipoprotein